MLLSNKRKKVESVILGTREEKRRERAERGRRTSCEVSHGGMLSREVTKQAEADLTGLFDETAGCLQWRLVFGRCSVCNGKL